MGLPAGATASWGPLTHACVEGIPRVFYRIRLFSRLYRVTKKKIMKRHVKLFENFSPGKKLWITSYLNGEVIGGIYDSEKEAKEARDKQLYTIWESLDQRSGPDRISFSKWLEQAESTPGFEEEEATWREFDLESSGDDMLKGILRSTPAESFYNLDVYEMKPWQTRKEMAKRLIGEGATLTRSSFLESFNNMREALDFFDGDLSWWGGDLDELERKFRVREVRKKLF